MDEIYKRYIYYFNNFCIGCSYNLFTPSKLESIKKDIKDELIPLKNLTDLSMLIYK